MIARIRRRTAAGLVILALSLGIPLGVALASHNFTDVPDSNIFHADIEALVNSGVTTGCAVAPARYCPSDYVTREQMAAFMNRLGALAPGKTPVVNATKLDGLDSVNILPGGNLPSGSTIRGSYTTVFTAAGAGAAGSSAITFGYTLGSVPTVHFIPVGGVAPAACPGSAANPTAQAGHLCVYETYAENVSSPCVAQTGPTWLCGVGDRFGASVYATSLGAGRAATVGAWAVTAPLGFTTAAEEPAPSCAEPPEC